MKKMKYLINTIIIITYGIYLAGCGSITREAKDVFKITNIDTTFKNFVTNSPTNKDNGTVFPSSRTVLLEREINQKDSDYTRYYPDFIRLGFFESIGIVGGNNANAIGTGLFGIFPMDNISDKFRGAENKVFTGGIYRLGVGEWRLRWFRDAANWTYGISLVEALVPDARAENILAAIYPFYIRKRIFLKETIPYVAVTPSLGVGLFPSQYLNASVSLDAGSIGGFNVRAYLGFAVGYNGKATPQIKNNDFVSNGQSITFPYAGLGVSFLDFLNIVPETLVEWKDYQHSSWDLGLIDLSLINTNANNSVFKDTSSSNFLKGFDLQIAKTNIAIPVLNNRFYIGTSLIRLLALGERRPMKQWMIRITKYAQRLLDDLDLVDWPNSTLEMQRNWIGRSEGAEINFQINDSSNFIRVFTTRPDTIFGATYLVLAPEHPLVLEITTNDNESKVKKYIEESTRKTDLERTELVKEKTGIFTGGYAINPATNQLIPIWIADYVLGHYGTGAIMAVPGHDDRDYEFAKKFNLPIVQVVKPTNNAEFDIQNGAFTSYDGVGMNSENQEISLNGIPTLIAKNKIIQWLEEKNIGKHKIQFKLRDWLFSRQRYWGEPIPIMFFEDGSKRSLEPEELPLKLPYISDFKPAGTGESPLAKVPEWVSFIDKKTGKKARFETNTMPQWAGSCWYYLRFIDPKNDTIFTDKDKEFYWMQPSGVDLYVGGAEHAVLHLLYARFWHKVLYDYGYVSTLEPFYKLFHQGLILGTDGRKMSKSLGNVVNPDEIINEYGADSLRLFEMFLGPLEQSKPWSSTGIEGVFRFLNKVWRLYIDNEGNLNQNIQDIKLTNEQEYVLHSTIKKVAEDIEKLRFNTAISQMMIFINEFSKSNVFPKEAAVKFILVLAPFAPHIAEEIWNKLGNTESITFAEFPEFDDSKTFKQTIEFVIQVNSKIRGKVFSSIDATQEQIQELALNDENTKKFIGNQSIVKVIFVKNKLINFIVK